MKAEGLNLVQGLGLLRLKIGVSDNWVHCSMSGLTPLCDCWVKPLACLEEVSCFVALS